MNDPDPRKRACDELAELLSTPDGLRTARLLQLTEALRVPEPAAGGGQGESSPAPGEPRPISIWQPRELGGEVVFSRPEPLPLGDHHARRPTFSATKTPGTTRICFFGESVAAGYLYAPHLTPAEVLERQLGQASRDGAYEVIDLARTNETLDPLVATVESSLQLDPDLLVLFAGNNWNLLETPSVSPYAPSVRARQRYALALRRAGLAGPADLARRDLRRRAEDALAAVAALARPRRLPVIVVIPEVNLADWEDRQPVPWLPGDGCARWYALYAEAAAHLEAGRHEAALAAAEAMQALDGGLCPTTHRLQALALVALGRLEDARQACEAEVANGCYATQAFLGAPRAAASVQNLLRREAARHGFIAVDLPRRFLEHTGSPLPGRRLFLDYCHLTAEGIGLAMAAVAGEILRLRCDAPNAPAAGGSATVVSVRADVEVAGATEALARLGAAVHGAHRLLAIGDKRPRLERWCREALAADPDVAGAMRDLLTVRCGPCPAVLNAAQQRNLASPHRLLLQHGWRWDYLDVDVIEALCAALEAAGHTVREHVDGLLLTHHGVGPRGADLTQPPYLAEPLERFYPEAMAPRGLSGRATYRAAWPESRFCLIADAAGDVDVELTARLPAIEGAPGERRGDVTLRLDGRDVASLALGESWTRHALRLPRRDLRRGIHRLTLAWPPLPPCGDAAFDSAVRRLENGVEADLHPVFGEVFSLVARRSIP